MPSKQFTAFISYSHADGEALAKELRQKINADARGKAITFWQDYSQMTYGQWNKQIEDAINTVEFLIILITPAALASPNCKNEWMYARKKGVPVLPVNGKPGDAGFYSSFPKWLGRQHIYHPDNNWERFINDLNTKPEVAKVPFMAPRLSEVANYVERAEKLKHLKELMLQADEPVSITTALQGSGGFGKTILAIAFCNDDDIINAFDDGILWVTLGQQKDTALHAMQKLYNAVSNDNKIFIDIEQAQQLLNEKLSCRNYLLVLDDVWHRVDAENILKAAGKCAVLITTRMDKLLLNAKQEQIDEMTKDEAITQLTNFTGTGNTAHNELSELAHKLGNWALLLRLAGAQLKARIDEEESIEKAIAYVNKKLERKGLLGFDREDAEQRNDSVQICLAASIELLKNEEREKLYSLGIFPEDENIPYAVLEKFWRVDDFDCEELLEKFHRYGLLDLDVAGKAIKMHDILLKYYETCLKDKPAQHFSLVKGFGDFNTWTIKYIWQWCIWHLSKAATTLEAIELLSNYQWIKGKLKAVGNLYDISSDYELITDSEEFRLIQKALLLSAVVIADDPEQLPHQLYGRLGAMENVISRKISEQALAALSKIKFTIKPLHPNLEIPDLYNLVFRGHSDQINGALLHDDILISWSNDNTLRSWSIKTGKITQIFEGHSHFVTGVLMLDDILISWSADKTLRSWNITSGKTIQVFEGHSSYVIGALIQHNNLISWSADKTLRSWNITSGKTKQIFKGHFREVSGALMQGDTLISWSADKTLHSWNITSGKTIQVFEGHSSYVIGALIHHNNLISWSADKTLRSWNITSGKIKHTFKGHSAKVDGVLIQGDILISWSQHEQNLRLWDIASGKIKHIFEGHSHWITGALLKEDTLISWSVDGTLRSWDTDSGKIKHIFEGHAYLVNGALIQDDTLISWSADTTLRSWNIDSGKIKHIFEGHAYFVVGALIQDDSLISWSGDKTLRSWDIASGRSKQPYEGHSSKVEGALIKSDILISWSVDKTLRAWGIETGETKQVFKGHSSYINGALIYNDCLISWSNDNTLRSWDIVSGDTKQIFKGHSSGITGTIMQNDTLISWCRDNGTLRSWDMDSGNTKHIFEMSLSIIEGALIHESTLISWSVLETLHSWDIDSGKYKQSFTGDSYGVIGALAQSDTLISWFRDNTIRSWNISSGEAKQVLTGHTSHVSNALIHGDNLISISLNELLMWDYSKAIIIKRLKGKRFKNLQILGKFLYILDEINTFWIYYFPGFEYVCRFTTDADITTIQVAEDLNRIIVGDASGKIHFLEPVGFTL